MTTFYLIRHAEKASPLDVLTGRSPGISLTETGRRQAERIAQHLAAKPIRSIVSSPLERAQETAAPLARTLRLSVELSPAITELDFGTWTRRTLGSLAGDPQWDAFNSFRSSNAPPGGESMLAAQARFVAEMQRLSAARPDEHVALVSHGDPIRAALLFFTGAPLDCWSRFEISVGSISVVTLSRYEAVIQSLNHMPA